MIAVLSATEHDYYAMPLPFAVYSWHKLGVPCIVFVPSGKNKKIELAKKYCGNMASFFEFECEEKRIPTYSQVVRLFAAAIPILSQYERLVTSDSDMCVFDPLLKLLHDPLSIEIVGADLTPADQYPMCYIKMMVSQWREVFKITKTYQEHVSELIDPIEGENIRGEQWCYDQWYAKKMIEERFGGKLKINNRSNGENQYAQNRADRDGWHFDPYTIMDAHLPRPLTDPDNFHKLKVLFNFKYPGEDLQWMTDYYNEYINIL